MKKMLGTRCPGCGTTDAPVHIPRWGQHGLGCIRCGLEATGGTFPEAIAAFYGPQPEESEGLPPCRCGAKALLGTPLKDTFLMFCHGCGAQTPRYDTAAKARACWRRMMEG